MMKITKIIQRISFFLIFTLICMGCVENGGNSFNASHIDEEMSAQHPPALVIGSKFSYQDTKTSDSKSYKMTMTVKERKEFEKKPAYWIEVTREGKRYFDIYDMNLNWIGSFGDGKELESAQPCIRVFKWPLRVGKKWLSAYTVQDYSGGVHLFRSKIEVNVRTYEDVKVPAGTFKAIRIQAGEETFWYAPSVGWAVKEEIEPRGKDGWLLELVEYTIPQKIHSDVARCDKEAFILQTALHARQKLISGVPYEVSSLW